MFLHFLMYKLLVLATELLSPDCFRCEAPKNENISSLAPFDSVTGNDWPSEQPNPTVKKTKTGAKTSVSDPQGLRSLAVKAAEETRQRLYAMEAAAQKPQSLIRRVRSK